ncbi:MAG: UPF0489 family protein [Candidatus Altimarinota bacterium]
MIQPPAWYQDGRNPFYQDGVFLPPGVGNNAFSFPKKPDRAPLAITPLKVGSLDELCLGTQVAFQDFDGDEWLECLGLESSILCLDYPIPIYIFDNHNHVFYAWCEALMMGWFQNGATLVHMDEHFDNSEPPFSIPTEACPELVKWVEESPSRNQAISPLRPHDPPTPLKRGNTPSTSVEMEKIYRYTNEVLQIATYIKPALKMGMFSECIDYVESKHFELPFRPPNLLTRGNQPGSTQNVVLNLDIDVFHPDMSHISWQQKMDVLKYYAPHAKLLTIATSPYFIDQQKAIDLAKRVVQELFG